MAEELPPCNECGACCWTREEFGRGGYVRLNDEDIKRLPHKYHLKVITESEFNVDRLGVRGTPATGYRCVALVGRIGEKTLCDIYEQRPELCRKYERGSVDCRKDRARWLYRESGT